MIVYCIETQAWTVAEDKTTHTPTNNSRSLVAIRLIVNLDGFVTEI